VSLPLKNGATLYVYELTQPNLATYSPVRFSQFAGLDGFAETVLREPRVLESTAFVERAIEGAFVPAGNVRLVFERGGVHVMATSAGRSALLLPVQFSHCYRVESSSPNVSVMRANVIHTLIVFEGVLDLRLRWKFGFLGDARCRQDDVRELRTLGLI
jgi:hypothetical protein